MNRPLRVLLVDDSENDALAVRRTLREGGFEPEIARVETEAALRRLLELEVWDVVISHYVLSRLNGLRALELAQNLAGDVPFLLVSEVSDAEVAVAVEALKAGANDYIMKEELERLSSSVDREIGKADARRRQRQRGRESARETEFLSRTAMRFLEFPLDADLFEFVADTVAATVSGAVAVVVSEYESETAMWHVRALAGLDNERERLRQLLNTSPLQVSVPTLQEFVPAVFSGKLERIDGGIAEFVRGGVDQSAAQAAQETFAVASIYTMALRRGETVFGGVTLFMREGGAEPARSLVEAFIRQAAVALDRRRSEAALRLAEDQLVQSQKMEALGQLAGGVAHDFNNILSVISCYSAFLLEGCPRRHHDDIKTIQDATQCASRLTQRLLAFSRRRVPRLEIVDVNGVVADVAKFLRRTIGEDVDLQTSLGSEVCNVECDRVQLEQIVLNLAVNARDAMPQGGTLRLDIENEDLDATDIEQHSEAKPGSYVKIAVTDTGCGMDAATSDRAFEPFFTTKTHGTGMGLATVYRIVKQNNGFLRLSSEPGDGTLFEVYLPRAEHPGLAVVPPLAARPRAACGETILVVEDEAPVRIALRRILGGAGYTVLEATDGWDALAVCESNGSTIDVLLTDIVMPGMSGRQLADSLRERYPEILPIFMSGHSAERVELRGLVGSDSPVVEKPFTADMILAKVSEVLGR